MRLANASHVLDAFLFMDTELKCNRLTCRISLNDRAVVTTCSHIFCVNCANELFSAARLCPACETCLSEPDDVVVCSLHPSNDYKTSVLSGLSPSTILEICSRAVSFWQYQIHQENSFQQAVLRNMNEKNAQLQKQLENVIREANGEISLLTNKRTELERDLELERRKVRDLQESSRERDKEYQRLKAQHDKIKRKALLAPNFGSGSPTEQTAMNAPFEDESHKVRNFGTSMGNAVDLGVVVEGMEANGIQRTPIVNRTSGVFSRTRSDNWPRQVQPTQRVPARQRLPPPADYPYHSGNSGNASDSASEVENILVGGHQPRRMSTSTGWAKPNNVLAAQRGTSFGARRTSGTFRPSVPVAR